MYLIRLLQNKNLAVKEHLLQLKNEAIVFFFPF